jgi:DNA-directed RNA polymerase specialized sigma24 family protein
MSELIKEYSQTVYDFCYYLFSSNQAAEETVLNIFREFGDVYRKGATKKGETWQPLEIRVRLFSIAWKHVRQAMQSAEFSWTPGRDTRGVHHQNGDLLKNWKKLKSQESNSGVLDRLQHVDTEFRAPLILKDILRFDDEEIVRILNIRWGVYRHRLHRGRLEFKDGLRGRPISSSVQGFQPSAPH